MVGAMDDVALHTQAYGYSSDNGASWSAPYSMPDPVHHSHQCCPMSRAMADEYGQTPVEAPKPDPDPEPKPEQPADLSGIMKLLQQILDFLKGIFGGAK